MAFRKKSIKIPINYGSPADINTGTTASLGSFTIHTPENGASTPVTWSSAVLFTAVQDTSTVTGGTLASFTASIQLSGSATSSVSAVGVGTLANSGENWGGIIGPIDYTNYFTANYGTVTAKSASFNIAQTTNTGTGTALRGTYGYMELTYIYNDTATRRSKTVCVPYESQLSTLTGTANTTFCTLPQLTGAGGWLNGYSNVTIADRWIEIKGNCNNNSGTNDHNLSYRFDAGATLTLPVRESALASDTYQVYQVDAAALSTTTTHTFQLWNSLVTRWANIIVNEWITFEYNVAGTTEALNYIEIPVEFDSPVPGTTPTVALRLKRPLTIQEPSTLTMRACAVEIDYNTAASATIAMKGGVQAAYRSYAQSSTVVAGQFSFQHGLDATSAQGAAFTLTRGENPIILDMYRSAGSAYNVTGVLKLLYSSGVSSQGIDSHADTRWGLNKQMSFTGVVDNTVTNEFFAIPDTNYWLQGLALQNYFWLQATTSTLTQQASVLASEAEGAGWRELFNDQFAGDNEIGYGLWTVRARPEFKRYPQDPDTSKLNVTSSRSYRTTSTTAIRYGTGWTAAYYNITSSIGGTISDSSGGTVNLYAFRGDTEEVYVTGSRVGNGAYNLTVYDDTLSYYVVAYESNTLKGVSKLATPATDFDISLTGGGGGGGEFFF